MAVKALHVQGHTAGSPRPAGLLPTTYLSLACSVRNERLGTTSKGTQCWRLLASMVAAKVLASPLATTTLNYTTATGHEC
eukprot:1161833-Pelagomonas_calceolata.AAC.6